MEVYIAAVVLGLCLSSMALGIFMSMKVFNIPDITTDGSYTLGAVVTAIMLSHQYSMYIIIPTVLGVGAIGGVCTALIHTKLKVDALLSGILVMTALYSINLTILGRSNLPLINTDNIFSKISFYNNSNLNSLVTMMLITSVIILLKSYLLKTDFGISMRATGNNSYMVRALGVNDEKIKVYGLAISNALTAFSGFLITQYQFYADINMGIGIVITGLGSVLISDAIRNLFKINSLISQITFVVLGAVIFQLVLAIALSIGINPNLLKLTTALFVLLIVVISKKMVRT